MGYPSYTSPKSQNEMIETLGHLLKVDIAAEVRMAKYFAICMDTTPDYSKKDQLSFIVCYVNQTGQIHSNY